MYSKMNKLLLFAVCYVIVTGNNGLASNAEMSDAEKAFKEHEVVPDVVPVAPLEIAEVAYLSGVEVYPGDELTPTKVKDQPRVLWNADPESFYTVCMTDPDAPSRARPTKREFQHWLVGNIPGGDISQGEVLTEYVGSAPPRESGLRRYVILIYKQKGKIQFSEKRMTNRDSSNRAKFSISKFARKYNLVNPVAGNFFQAQYDDYVPSVHAQFKS